jgi:hypothetical protein
MFPILLYLTAVTPAFAPAPVLRSQSWELAKMHSQDYTITVKHNGRETVFDVARDVGVTMNGRWGYDWIDLGDTSMSHEPKVTLTIKHGLVKSIDVKLTLRKGEKLWAPGMGPGRKWRRELEEVIRQVEEVKRKDEEQRRKRKR